MPNNKGDYALNSHLTWTDIMVIHTTRKRIKKLIENRQRNLLLLLNSKDASFGIIFIKNNGIRLYNLRFCCNEKVIIKNFSILPLINERTHSQS